jgi:hypothetical protein
MKKTIQITLFLLSICFSKISLAQSYPVGLSVDSITLSEDLKYVNFSITSSMWSKFIIYKPANYDSLTSPILLAIHGSGGSGNTTAGILQNIADRRGAMIIAPNMNSNPVRSAEMTENTRDTISSCSALRSGTFFLRSFTNKYYKENQEIQYRPI